MGWLSTIAAIVQGFLKAIGLWRDARERKAGATENQSEAMANEEKRVVDAANAGAAAGGGATNRTPLTATGNSPLVCSQWLPITYASKHDTPETVMQVRRNNAARGAYCAR